MGEHTNILREENPKQDEKHYCFWGCGAGIRGCICCHYCEDNNDCEVRCRDSYVHPDVTFHCDCLNYKH